MKNLLSLAMIAIIIALSGCKQRKSNTALFIESYEQNIEACAAEMMRNGADSAYAVEKCACMIKTAFEFDSTMITMRGKELSDFLKANIFEIESICDSALTAPVDTVAWMNFKQ